jgi:hypothetical protein
MLAQLWAYWIEYQAGAWSTRKMDLEVRSWMDQHCLDADDFAFGLGCALRDRLNASVG